MAVTSTFQRKLGKQVFEKMLSEGLTVFNEGVCVKNIYALLRREQVQEGMSYQCRMISPLVKDRFKNLAKKQRKEKPQPKSADEPIEESSPLVKMFGVEAAAEIMEGARNADYHHHQTLGKDY
jgi:hypothetical protein